MIILGCPCGLSRGTQRFFNFSVPQREQLLQVLFFKLKHTEHCNKAKLMHVPKERTGNSKDKKWSGRKQMLVTKKAHQKYTNLLTTNYTFTEKAKKVWWLIMEFLGYRSLSGGGALVYSGSAFVCHTAEPSKIIGISVGSLGPSGVWTAPHASSAWTWRMPSLRL